MYRLRSATFDALDDGALLLKDVDGVSGGDPAPLALTVNVDGRPQKRTLLPGESAVFRYGDGIALALDFAATGDTISSRLLRE